MRYTPERARRDMLVGATYCIDANESAVKHQPNTDPLVLGIKFKYRVLNADLHTLIGHALLVSGGVVGIVSLIQRDVDPLVADPTRTHRLPSRVRWANSVCHDQVVWRNDRWRRAHLQSVCATCLRVDGEREGGTR